MTQNDKIKRQPRGVISIRRGVAILFAALLVTTSSLAAVTLARLASHDSAAAPGAANPATPPALKVEHSSTAQTVPAATAPTAAPQQQQGGRDEVRIEMSTNGFTPGGVTHAAGNFALAVENQGIEGEYVLQLKGAAGTLLREVRVQKGSTAWTVELAAGSYTLVEANHPDWVCHITVQ